MKVGDEADAVSGETSGPAGECEGTVLCFEIICFDEGTVGKRASSGGNEGEKLFQLPRCTRVDRNEI